jgi:nicotinamide mononucleotide transporter
LTVPSELLQATRPLLAEAFVVWGSPVSWLELLAVALSLWMVERNLRVSPWAWPLAIAASLLYALLFGHSALYGESALQFLFIGVALWGWRQWLVGRDDHGRPLELRRMTVQQRRLVAAVTLAAWPALGWVLDHATDSELPYFDALPTVGSVAGQLLLGLKRVENWLVWLAVNVLSVALFAYKSLWLTAVLYALFAALSVIGWRAWTRRMTHGTA